MGQALSGQAWSCGLGALGEFECIGDVPARHETDPAPACSSHHHRLSPRRLLTGDSAASQEVCVGDGHLAAHRRPREKSASTWDTLISALRTSAVCQMLDDNDFESLAGALEYHVFNAGEVITHAATLGGHYFVAETDGVEVWLEGGSAGTIPRGRAFGETALLQRYPRRFSVIATHAGVGVWAAEGRLFRKAVQASIMQQLSEQRTFLDSISLFEGFTTRQIDDISDCCSLQVVNAGECISQMGCPSQYVFLVKSGKLRVVAGGHSDSRSGNGGEMLLGAKSCICERVLMYDESFSMTTEAIKRCQLLRIDMQRLKHNLGHILCPIRLQQSFLRRVMQNSGQFSTWATARLAEACEAMELVEYAADSKGSIPQNFFVVIDGSCKLGNGAASQSLRRGHWHGEPNMCSSPSRIQAKGGAIPSKALVSGPQGCRVAVLPFDSDASSASEDPDRGHARMARILSKVCVFRHLPQWQLDILVNGLTTKRYKKGEKVILQGDPGAKFYIIVEGECFVSIDGKVVRKLARFAYFGERALLFEEPRAATVEVASWAGAEIWAIDKESFRRVVRDKTLTADQLRYRVWLQDPGLELKDLTRLGVIGCGTSGVVHLVKHKRSGFTYALKRVSKKDGKIPRQVRREIEVLAENDHPFIMHLVKTIEMPNCVFLITEYIAGGELHAAIRTISTVLSRSQSMFYTGSMLLMLEALSDRDIVYRDLKPENLMLDAQGYLKLIDFGSAKHLESSCLRTFTMVGTPHYMAPEVMRGKGYGTEVDIWALGVILYELVCGYLPFGDNCESTGDVCKEVLTGNLQFPSDLEGITRELIEGLLVPKPHLRLGCNTQGYEEIKKKPFFSLDGLVVDGLDNEDKSLKGADFFSLLIGRELQAPIPPTLQEPTKSGHAEDDTDYWNLDGYQPVPLPH